MPLSHPRADGEALAQQLAKVQKFGVNVASSLAVAVWACAYSRGEVEVKMKEEL